MPEQNDSSRMLVQPEGRAALAALLADLRSCLPLNRISSQIGSPASWTRYAAENAMALQT
jgi:hypothetical protein